jgi:preprotein translocase subunit SecG
VAEHDFQAGLLMSLFVFLSVVQAIVALLLVVVILIQKSEGGGLGVGGSPSGFMSARGAADFLTCATTILAAIFVGLSIVLAALAVGTNSTHQIDTSLNRSPPTQSAPDPLAGGSGGWRDRAGCSPRRRSLRRGQSRCPATRCRVPRSSNTSTA